MKMKKLVLLLCMPFFLTTCAILPTGTALLTTQTTTAAISGKDAIGYVGAIGGLYYLYLAYDSTDKADKPNKIYAAMELLLKAGALLALTSLEPSIDATGSRNPPAKQSSGPVFARIEDQNLTIMKDPNDPTSSTIALSELASLTIDTETVNTDLVAAKLVRTNSTKVESIFIKDPEDITLTAKIQVEGEFNDQLRPISIPLLDIDSLKSPSLKSSKPLFEN